MNLPDPAPPSPSPPPPREETLAFDRQVQTVALGLLILVLFIHLLQTFATVLQELFIAAFLAYAILPAHRWLMRRGLAPSFSFLFIVLAFLACAFGLGQMTYASAEDLRQEMPRYETRLRQLGQQAADAFGLATNPVDDFLRAEPMSEQNLGAFLRATLGSFFGYLGQAVVVLIFLIFLLAERDGLARRIVEGYGEHRAPRIMAIVGRINTGIEQYLAVKTWVSILAGVLTAAVLVVFGVNYAPFWGVVTFALNFIPYLGSQIAVALPVLLCLVQYGLWPALALVVVLLAIQNGIGYYIEPRMAGRRLDLSPLVIILSLTFWGSLWGIVGMILAVPLVVVVKTVLENIPQTRPLAMLLSNR